MHILPHINALLILWALLAMLLGDLRFLSAHGALYVSSGLWRPAIAAAIVCTSILTLRGRGSFKNRLAAACPLGPAHAATALAAIALSHHSIEQRSFFSGPRIVAAFFVLSLAAAVLIPRLRRFSGILDRYALPALLIVSALPAAAFFEHTGLRPVFSDDHPSFLYRYALLREQFPELLFYNTDWNSGYSAREFFATGILNTFVAAFPLILWVGDFASAEGAWVYNVIIAYLFLALVPLAVYAAARALERSRLEALAAGILALAPTLHLFEWLLRYGTLGFLFSAGMLPLALVYAARVGFSREIRYRDVAVLLVLSFVCVAWSMGVVYFVPVLIGSVISLVKGREPKRLRAVLIFAVLFAAVNLPWVKIFVEESKVVQFIQGGALPGTDGSAANADAWHVVADALRDLRRSIAAALVVANPLVVLTAVFGIFAWRPGPVRAVWSATAVWLLAAAFILTELKPQLELGRMVIPALFLLAVPAGTGVVALISRFPGRALWDGIRLAPGRALSSAAIAGALATTVLVSASAYRSQTGARFITAPAYLEKLTEAIRTYGGDGRVFILSFVLHELGASAYNTQDGGHVAPLPLLTGKPHVAMDFYHSKWAFVDPIPSAFRKRKREGIEEFLDLHNVTAVITHNRPWREYCRRNPRYREVAQIDRFRIYEREPSAGGFVLRGSAQVSRKRNRIVVRPGSKEFVLKYRYHRRLRVYPPSAEAELFPVHVYDEELGGGRSAAVSFVGVRLSGEPSGEISIGF